MAAYKRIVIKLSGETLAPVLKGKNFDELPKNSSVCYSEDRINETARMLIRLSEMGIQVGVVLGGGNIWRGRFSDSMDPVDADQMGMLATIMNATAAKEAVTRLGGKAAVLTAQEMTRFARLYTRDAALELMEKGYIVFLAGGSGNPFFTTDTAGALRAAELKADAYFKGTNVEGVFDSDPRKNPNAKLLKELTYQQAIDMQLHVMDSTAFSLCMEKNVPFIRVFNMDDLENIIRVCSGEELGSVVHK